MGFLNRIDRSAELVTGMAERLDHSLADRIAADPETYGPAFRKMVLSCTGCRDQAECARLQAENRHLDAAPAYCRNRQVFETA